MKLILSLIAISAALAATSASALACSSAQERAAVLSYYDNGSSANVALSNLGAHRYGVSTFDKEENANCAGGIASVNAACEVIVEQSLTCNPAN